MPEWTSKEEYVLNDQGLIWRGTHNQMKTTHWNFAQVSERCHRCLLTNANIICIILQFEENILEACLYALSNVGKLSPSDR